LFPPVTNWQTSAVLVVASPSDDDGDDDEEGENDEEANGEAVVDMLLTTPESVGLLRLLA